MGKNKNEDLEELEDSPRAYKHDMEDEKKEEGEEAFAEDIDLTGFESYTVSILEFAIYNSFLGRCRKQEIEGFKVLSYGEIKSVTSMCYGRRVIPTHPYWYVIRYNRDGYDTNIILHTIIYQNSAGQICTELNISFEKDVPMKLATELYDIFNVIAFNNSEYNGKCLSVKIYDGSFHSIEIVPTDDFASNLVLSKVQNKFLQHFEDRVKRGGNARYLLNGEPGTGKTESIRQIITNLTPNVTFVMPDFKTPDDLKTILTACEIFDPGVIVIDDIDLYLGSRDKGNSSYLLADFLTFFDGVRKRKISLLASTNNKDLVDKAAERPGRFNITLDFSFLNDEQIEEVCKIHLPKEWCNKEVYDCLRGNDKNGHKINVTGAFIANLADNLKEMIEDAKSWKTEDTIFLIKESYAGFYSSQLSKAKKLGYN